MVSAVMRYTLLGPEPTSNTVDLVRGLCDLADQYADGYLRFTIRNSVELCYRKSESIR
jgi:sulfite reductase beta subunit